MQNLTIATFSRNQKSYYAMTPCTYFNAKIFKIRIGLSKNPWVIQYSYLSIINENICLFTVGGLWCTTGGLWVTSTPEAGPPLTTPP